MSPETATKPTRLRTFVVGMFVALAKQAHKFAVEHGISVTISASPQGTSIFFFAGPVPEMPDARPVPHSDHMHVAIDGVSVTWRDR